MLKPKNKDKNKKRGELRRSQLVTTFGCGAIVDLPDISGMISGIDNWKINCKEDRSGCGYILRREAYEDKKKTEGFNEFSSRESV